jgi:hypothetical protein
MEELPSLPSECSSRTAALWASTLLLQEGAERGWDFVETRHAMLVLAINVFPRDVTEVAVMAEIQEIVRRVLTNRRRSPGLGSH